MDEKMLMQGTWYKIQGTLWGKEFRNFDAIKKQMGCVKHCQCDILFFLSTKQIIHERYRTHERKATIGLG